MNYPAISWLFFTLIFLSGLQPLSAQQSVDSFSQPTSIDKIQRAYAGGNLSLDDKIRYQAFALHEPGKLPPRFQVAGTVPEKCGTPLLMEFNRNRDLLSVSTVSAVESMVGQSSQQASETYTSDSGKFQIHYDTSGTHAVPEADDDNTSIPDYVEWVAEAADSSWSHEVGTLGYTDFILGPSQPYEVYIRNLQSYYGGTVSTGNTTYIEIENDFAENFPPNTDPEGDQKGAVKATMAHEIKHAVQYAATEWKGETDKWAEMDATLMEEVVYDNVNDYYNYLDNSDSIFNNPQESFYPGSYYHVTWALYFEEKHGPQFWPQVWDNIESNPDITMINALTEELGSEYIFNNNYLESQMWHFASGSGNATQDFGFEEREAYPTPNITYNFFGSDSLDLAQNSADSLNSLSAKYIEIEPSPFPGFAAFEFANISSPETGFGIIGYFADGTSDVIMLNTENRNSIEYQTTWEWGSLVKIGVVVSNSDTNNKSGYRIFVRSTNPQMVRLEQNYPNPFKGTTTIQYSIPERQQVKLEIYDILGRKVRTLVDSIKPRGIYPVLFDTNELASGIYIYRLVTEEETFVKKMTLIK